MAAYYNEFDPGAAAWLRELIRYGEIADGEVDERSILDVRPVDLRGFTQCHFFAGIGGWSYALRLAGWPDDRPVWTGSPPCQPFSAAGKGLGRDDARHLGPHFVGLVRAARPAVLFGEQVASAAVFGKAASGSKRAAARAPEWAWFDDLSDRLEAARYAVGASDIPAAVVGAPHIRQRCFFGAKRLGDALDSGRQLEPHVARSDGPGVEPRGRQSEQSGQASGDADGLEHPASDGRVERRAEPSWRGTSGGCASERLADFDSKGSLPGAQRGIYRGQEGSGSRNGEPERSGAACGLENTDLSEEQRFGQHSGQGLFIEEAMRSSRGGMADGLEPDRGDSRLFLERTTDEQAQPGRIVSGALGSASEAGQSCGVSDADEFGRVGWRSGGSGDESCEVERSARLRTTAPRSPATSAHHIPWRDADWLFCRDGKWRPVIASHVGVFDGLPDDLVRGGDLGLQGETQAQEGEVDAEASQADAGTLLQSVQREDGAQEDQRAARGSCRVQEAGLLRPNLHGGGDGKGPLHERQSQSIEGVQADEASLRGVRRKREAARPSQGRGPFEQRSVELEDIVSAPPSQIALAQLHGRLRDAQALQALCKSICEAGPLLFPPDQVQQAWRSLSREDQDRIKLAFGPVWVARQFSPLSSGEPARVMRLRGYGNAIVPQAAAIFIQEFDAAIAAGQWGSI